MKVKKCPVCEKGSLVTVEDILSEIEGYIFVEKGERCTHCGEEFIPEDEGERMIKIARKLKLWGEPLKLYSIYSPPEHHSNRIDIRQPQLIEQFTGHKDIDILIMLELDDETLNIFCKTS